MSVPILETPQVPADERVRLRARLVVEECLEFVEALFDVGDRRPIHAEMSVLKKCAARLIADADVKVDLVEAVDAMADVMYVVAGSALEMGVNLDPVLDEVHRSNLEKRNGPVDEYGKVGKPPGWTPPDIAGCLERQRAGGPESLAGVMARDALYVAAGFEEDES